MEWVNEWRADALESGKNIVWETVFSHPSRLDEIARAKKQGYYVLLIYVTTLSPEINVERVNRTAEVARKNRAQLLGEPPRSRAHLFG